jgi:2-polyprenyl-6-methoxyphenol hydroxylase-like FAD-dependent oxidoreductase
MPTSLQDLHICVIGSGIGGLSTAMSLLSTLPAASNTKVSIFEREPSLLARTGYGLTLTYDPSGPLASLDLLEACACADTPSRSHYLFSDSGHVLGYVRPRRPQGGFVRGVAPRQPPIGPASAAEERAAVFGSLRWRAACWRHI